MTFARYQRSSRQRDSDDKLGRLLSQLDAIAEVMECMSLQSISDVAARDGERQLDRIGRVLRQAKRQAAV